MSQTVRPGSNGDGLRHTPRRLPKKLRISRRRLLTDLGLAGGLIGIGAYMRVLEPFLLERNEETVEISRTLLRRPVTVLHLSDLHYSDVIPIEFIDRAVQWGLAARPDLICLTGDYLTHGFPDQGAIAEVLRKLSAAAPTVACQGNHDGGRWAERFNVDISTPRMIQLMESCDIDYLLNCSKSVSLPGQVLRLVGVGDLWARETNVERAFAQVSSDERTPRLVLCHNPDGKELLADREWELMLSGHTHGGQLSLPLIGEPFAPVQDKRYVHGLHRWKDRWIHITRGVGSLFALRFSCRPEVSVLRLVPAGESA